MKEMVHAVAFVSSDCDVGQGEKSCVISESNQ